MTIKTPKQLQALGIFLITYALLAFFFYLFAPLDQLLPTGSVSSVPITLPKWVLGLANAGIILVLYGVLGLAGYWFATKVGLPKVYREDARWRDWFTLPLLYGLALGAVVVGIDRFFASISPKIDFPHPAFPYSLIAAVTAAIGEEILFRFFILGWWAFLLNLIMRRWGANRLALWVANVLAALAFAAGHLPAAMLLFDVSSPAQIPTTVILEIFLLNGILGLAAGEQYIQNGLVAAIGVHFWADIVWHVIWPHII